jgi:hypothetical protein
MSDGQVPPPMMMDGRGCELKAMISLLTLAMTVHDEQSEWNNITLNFFFWGY